MSETTLIKPELIRWAVHRSRVAVESLVESFPKLAQWERGEQGPTLKQLEKFAAKTMTPLGYFFLERPPQEPLGIADFRTVGDAAIQPPSPNLLETIQAMQQRQDWMRDYLIEQGHGKLEFVGSAKDDKDVVGLATRIRKSLALAEHWSESENWEVGFRRFREAAESLGILVMMNSIVGLNTHRGLDPDEFRGFVLCDAYAPLVFVNSNDAKSAQMFTLAHEIAHVWVGRDGLFNLIRTVSDHDAKERFCNRVAAEFLVPQKILLQRWGTVQDDQPFRALSKLFKVSPIVIARRAWDLKLIPKDRFFAFYNKEQEDWHDRKAEVKAKKQSGGPNFYTVQNVRLGQRFPAAIIAAVRSGRLLHRDAFRLTDLHGKTFNNYANIFSQKGRDERA